VRGEHGAGRGGGGRGGGGEEDGGGGEYSGSGGDDDHHGGDGGDDADYYDDGDGDVILFGYALERDDYGFGSTHSLPAAILANWVDFSTVAFSAAAALSLAIAEQLDGGDLSASALGASGVAGGLRGPTAWLFTCQTAARTALLLRLVTTHSRSFFLAQVLTTS
jgi:hypothetical protein